MEHSPHQVGRLKWSEYLEAVKVSLYRTEGDSKVQEVPRVIHRNPLLHDAEAWVEQCT